jgi:small subunit ribosomal protein S15
MTPRAPVPVACLTTRIKYLGEHMAAHHKDKHCAYGLNKLVHRRRALLAYLKRHSVARYYKLITSLQLRDVV